ncbi:MAG: hypothetical protein JW976_08445 [Syntrophaceae bacterium]|nr:hypothetical protein [Syntrophaceae bacterium]
MGNDIFVIFLVFLSINIVIYVALLRWASRINDIEKNLESINAKLDMLTELTLKLQEEGVGIKIDNNLNNEALH